MYFSKIVRFPCIFTDFQPHHLIVRQSFDPLLATSLEPLIIVRVCAERA